MKMTKISLFMAAMLGRSTWPPKRIFMVALACFTIVLATHSAEVSATQGRYALVAGFSSDNVIRFDLSDGSSQELIQLQAGSDPRGIAVDTEENIYVGLRSLSQNVKRFTSAGVFVDDFTSSTGGFGIGLMDFHESGDLFVARNISSGDYVYRYDTSGNLIDSLNMSNLTNVVGVMVNGQDLYSAAYFSGTTVQYNLAENPVTGEVIIPGTNLDSPIGMTIGHNGNLFIACNGNGLIQEFNSQTNAFVGTFVDVTTFGASSALWDLHFDEITGHYFFTAGNALYEMDATADYVDVYTDARLSTAYGFAIVPEPATLGVLIMGGLALLRRRQ